MSLRAAPIEPIPDMTARVAKTAFPKGNLYLQMREERGTIFKDQDFEAIYPKQG